MIPAQSTALRLYELRRRYSRPTPSHILPSTHPFDHEFRRSPRPKARGSTAEQRWSLVRWYAQSSSAFVGLTALAAAPITPRAALSTVGVPCWFWSAFF